MGARTFRSHVTLDTQGEPAAGQTTAADIAADGDEIVLVLSRDESLIDTLQVVAFPNEVLAFGREAELMASLAAQEGTVVLLDAAAISRPIAQLTERLKDQFPDVVLIVAGSADEQKAVTAQITDGTVYRFLAKPFSVQRIRLFLEAAWRRRSQQSTQLDSRPVAPIPLSPGTGNRRNIGLIVTIAAVALFTAWLGFLKMKTAPPGATQASAALPAGPSHDSLVDVLERAGAALEQGDLGTAADLYSDAQRIDPSDARVASGIDRVMPKLLAAAQTQLQEQHLGQAEQLTKHAWTLRPDNREVAELLTQLAAAREQSSAPGAVAPAAPAVAAAPPQAPAAEKPRAAGKVQEYLRLAQERMHEGSLVDPQDGSARYFIAQARTLAPGAPAVRQAERQLLGQVIDEAHKAVLANEPDDAERWIAAAADLGARPDEVASLTLEVQRERTATQAAATDQAAALFSERLSQGRILDPPTDSAKFYLAELVRNAPGKPAAQLARQLFQARLLAEAQDAVRRKDYTSARRWLAEGHADHVDAASLASVESALAIAQAATRAPAPAASPAPVTSARVALHLIHYVKAVYPVLRWSTLSPITGGKGIVNLEVTVNAQGTPTNLKILSAYPPHVFDRAAIDAVSQWRYQPPVLSNGQPTPVQTRIRLIFQPPQTAP